MNDLALCGTRLGTYASALTALDKATALEKVNGEQIRRALTSLFAVNYETTQIETDEQALSLLKTLNFKLAPGRPILFEAPRRTTTWRSKGLRTTACSCETRRPGGGSASRSKNSVETAAAIHTAS